MARAIRHYIPGQIIFIYQHIILVQSYFDFVAAPLADI